MLMRFVLLLSLLAVQPVLFAAETSEGTSSESDISEVPETLKDARTTMQTFVNAMAAVSEGEKGQIEIAISTMDLSYLPAVIRQQKGRGLSTILLSVIERSKTVVLNQIPRQPKGDKYIFGRYSQGNVTILKQADGRWLFSQTSLRALPDILEGLLDAPAKNGTKDPKVVLPF